IWRRFRSPPPRSSSRSSPPWTIPSTAAAAPSFARVRPSTRAPSHPRLDRPARERSPMKITGVRTIPLRGATHDTGWPGGTAPEEQMNTLVEIQTDEGLTGLGSCFTSRPFVQASLTLLEPWLVGETPYEAERVSEKLRQLSFWQGRGGAVEHTISGLDIALWDLMGKALGQPVSRLLGGNYRDRIKPYASILFDDPPVLREKLQQKVARGFRAIKMGWR